VAEAGTAEGVAKEVEDFVLNRPEYREAAGRDGVGTAILVAGDNFGCGSSREHAPWSICGMGIRAIISSSFADIFHSNCMKNGMLPVTLPREQVLELLADAEALKQIEIDLPSQQVVRECGTSYSFDVDPFRKNCLLNGFDDIGLTLQKMEVWKRAVARHHLPQARPLLSFHAPSFPLLSPWPLAPGHPLVRG